MTVKRATTLQRWALGLLVLAALPAFAARAETPADCAKIEDAFAYNRCLAAHGPVAGQAHVLAVPEGVEPGAGRPQGAFPVRRGRNGRMSATITVEPAKPSPRSGKSARPSSLAF
jgi:hypothetical protein